MPTEDLIARFQQVSEQSIGTDTVATAGGFVALDEPLKFGGGILGTPQPEVSPVMRELVRRGAAALPALLAHLTDDRRTKLVLQDNAGSPGFGGMWFGNEYDPRDPAVIELAHGLKLVGQSYTSSDSDEGLEIAPGEDADEDGYHVKVGDLCYVTLGQIVNRRLAVARYQPTACLVLSSPVRTPALAAAARADWNHLTEADFKAALTHDMTNPAEGVSSTDALQRMLFYYPTDSQAMAVALLDQPLYSDRMAGRFVVKLADADDQQQDKLLADFKAKYGEAQYQAAVHRLIETSLEPPLDPALPKDFREQARKQVAAANKLVDRRFAAGDKHPAVMRLPTNCIYQQSVVDTLAGIPSSTIDRATRALLRRTLVLQTDDMHDKDCQCGLAAACAKRFVAPVRRKALDRATDRLRSHDSYDQISEKATRAYFRECDTFLHKLATDPKLLPSGANP